MFVCECENVWVCLCGCVRVNMKQRMFTSSEQQVIKYKHLCQGCELKLMSLIWSLSLSV